MEAGLPKNQRRNLRESARQYALGKLDGDAAERFESLLVEDTHTQQLLEDVEGDLCEEYLFKLLAPNDKTAFEENYLQAESHLLRLEGIRCVNADRLLNPSLAEVSTKESTSMRSQQAPIRRIAVPVLSLLSIGIIAALSYYTFLRSVGPNKSPLENANSNVQSHERLATAENKNDGNQNENSVANRRESKPTHRDGRRTQIVIASVVLSPAPKMGGEATKTPTVHVIARTGRVALIVRLKAALFTHFVATLERTNGSRVPVIVSYKPPVEDVREIVIYVDASLLDDGFHTLTLSGIRQDDNPEFINEYPFLVERR